MADYVGLSFTPHNDLTVDATGSPVLVFDAAAIAQHIRQRVMFWQGEWYLDKAAGIAWTTYILGRPPSEIAIAESIIKAEIAATPGVTNILEFDASYDRRSRGLRINRCQVLTVFDDILDIQF